MAQLVEHLTGDLRVASSRFTRDTGVSFSKTFYQLLGTGLTRKTGYCPDMTETLLCGT